MSACACVHVCVMCVLSVCECTRESVGACVRVRVHVMHTDKEMALVRAITAENEIIRSMIQLAVAGQCVVLQ